jgi:CBS domain-containing protein
VRHLPILDDAGHLVGVITDRDIRQAGDFGESTLMGQEAIEQFGMMTVSELMTTQVVTVRGDTALIEAAELFLTHKFGCLPVVREDDTLAGILTVTDVLALFVQ